MERPGSRWGEGTARGAQGHHSGPITLCVQNQAGGSPEGMGELLAGLWCEVGGPIARAEAGRRARF